jgi:hypothetical protein
MLAYKTYTRCFACITWKRGDAFRWLSRGLVTHNLQEGKKGRAGAFYLFRPCRMALSF